MKQILTTLSLSFFLFTGCQVQSHLGEAPDEVLYFESIGFGQTGSVRDTLEVMLRDENSYRDALEMVTPLGELPDVDFSQTMVGLIAIPTNSGGYTVEVKSVEKTGEEITVSYLFSMPGEDCMTVQALSLPFQIVIIRWAEGNVTFVRDTERYSCAI